MSEAQSSGASSAAPFLVERGDRMRMTFTGDKAKEALGGLVTNDVVSLRAGTGQRAAALTPKGRVIALCRIFDRGSDLLVDCDAAAGEGFASMIRKFVNPRLAKYALVTGTTGCVGVHGDGASVAVAAALASVSLGGRDGADSGAGLASRLEALAPMDGIAVGEGDAAAYIVRSAELSAPGFELVASTARVAEVRAALVAAGVRTATTEEVLVLRVEAGVPEWGTEMDIETIPQEAVLDDLGAISFNKGCYTGQEVVARIHFRGHVNRLLRLLVSESPLAVGSRVIDAAGTDVGEVRTSVVSATRGPLAIAMVRREVEPGSDVTVRSGTSEVRARVSPLVPVGGMPT